MISKFIAGSSAQSAAKRAKAIYSQYGWHSIVDYAREGSTTPQDVTRYYERLVHQDIPNHFLCSRDQQYLHFAIKLSSFLPFNPEYHINKTIENILYSTNSANNTCIYLDAEDDELLSKETIIFNDAIRRWNTQQIHKTYQMYRKDAVTSLLADFDALGDSDYGIKLVRGAYIKKDRARGVIFDTKNETHQAYNNTLQFLLSETRHPLLIATHNNESVEIAVKHMKTASDKLRKVKFAQLLGMNDKLSLSLSQQGFVVCKYLPYGSLLETYPYLLRRCVENLDVVMTHGFNNR